jgi:molybdate transport system substrate-binding protein
VKGLLFLFALPCCAIAAEKLAIAAAANLIYALEPLHEEFKRANSDLAIALNTGASGNLVAQIQNGAPFDVFLSADVEYPQHLVKRGAAEEKSFCVFARGRLVLWTTQPGVGVSSIKDVMQNPSVVRVAVANRQTAPYGRAAEEALKKLGLWEIAAPKLVTGENITQTAQFVETGNAGAGFVSLSLVVSPRLKDRGKWLLVPDELHSPLDHAGVITKRGATNPAAARYFAFLRSPAAREIFERFGYTVPKQ